MRAAAQLERHPRHVDDAHHVPVFLTEQRHRPRRNRLLVRRLPGLDREILPHVRIDFGLDRGELIALDRTVMAEVEAQPLGRDDRTRLTHVGAEDFAQRGMH